LFFTEFLLWKITPKGGYYFGSNLAMNFAHGQIAAEKLLEIYW